MTTLKVIVEDEQVGLLKMFLREISFIKSVEEESVLYNHLKERESAYEKLKKIQQEIGNKQLFKEIKDPSEWQREVRKEWDRDF